MVVVANPSTFAAEGTKVNPQVLRSAATDIAAQRGELDESIAALQVASTQLLDSWQGEGSEGVTAIITLLLDCLDKTSKALAIVSAKLVASADDYEALDEVLAVSHQEVGR